MADGVLLYTNPQQSPPSTTAQNKNNPTKFYSHFIFKVIILTLFLVTIPLCPSPNVDTPSTFSRWWELLHLIFVGIAVSYGLFSRKNIDLMAENNTNTSKFDNAQSYITRLLQVPSVFYDDDDDAVDSPTDNNINKIQTWSSQYYRNQPVLVVAKDGSRVGEKPLLLPVRSLKSRVSDENDLELINKVNSRSNSSHSPRDFSRRIGRNDVNLIDEEETRSNSSASEKGMVSDYKKMSRNNSEKSRTSVNNDIRYVNGDGEGSRTLSKSNLSLSSRSFSSISRKSYWGSDDEETMLTNRTREIDEEEERSEDIDSDVTEKSKRSGYNPISKPAFSEFPKDTKDFLEQDPVETDYESGSEDENYVQGVDLEPADVDKKADEFIAKFREQIRFQRSSASRDQLGNLREAL